MSKENKYTEEWKIIPFANSYEISTFGSIRSLETKILLKSTPNYNNYRQIDLLLNERSNDSRKPNKQRFLVHVLVATVFIGEKPTPKHTVNHKDGVHDNNKLYNLEWMTPKQQSQH